MKKKNMEGIKFIQKHKFITLFMQQISVYFFFLAYFVSCSQGKSQQVTLTQVEKDSLVERCIEREFSTIGVFKFRIECAVYFDNYQKLKQFHQEGEPINFVKTNGANLFHVASKYYSGIQILDYLYDNKVNINQLENGWLPLNYASLYGNFDAVRFFLDKGSIIDVNRKVSPVENAISSGKKDAFEIIKLLVQKGAELNDKEFPPIFRAMGLEQLKVLEYLLENGADPNVTAGEGNRGWNSLHYAVYFECEKCIDILLKYNVNDNAKSTGRYWKGEIATEHFVEFPMGSTPLDMAKALNNKILIRKLR